jgi:hypothetical protein
MTVPACVDVTVLNVHSPQCSRVHFLGPAGPAGSVFIFIEEKWSKNRLWSGLYEVCILLFL